MIILIGKVYSQHMSDLVSGVSVGLCPVCVSSSTACVGGGPMDIGHCHNQ